MTDKERIKTIIQQYADKGERLLKESYENGEHASTTGYWDGYNDCANLLLRELEDIKQEPVSEDLEKEILRYNDSLKLDANDSYEWDDIAANVILAARHFANWQKNNLWKPADGDDLPEYDREVIAILDCDFGHYKVVYAHRPNPNGWNGTNIDTGEKEHFEPEIYDKGGWNQPHVLYWIDAKLPYEENKIDKEIEL